MKRVALTVLICLLSVSVTAQEEMIVEFTDTLNTSILGMASCRTNWSLARSSNTGTEMAIGEQTMSNSHVREFIDKFELLSEICIQDENECEEWE